MSSLSSRDQLSQRYEEAAQAYLRALPPEHFMESTAQAQQRKITVESLDLVSARRPDVQVFNELLVQYEVPGDDEVRGVVPDNMVVLHHEKIDANGSYALALQPVGPFWVLEYVSKSNARKDYEQNFQRYERELKVPYYLLFYPETQDMTLYRRGPRRYVSVKPSEVGRCAIPEIELELAIHEGWMRFWFRGELLPLTPELEQQMVQWKERAAEAQRQLRRVQRERRRESRRADEAEQRAEAAEEANRRLAELLRQHGIDPGQR